MSSKEKAEELVNKFDLPTGLMSSERKQCALIAVNEMLDEIRCIVELYDIGDSYVGYWEGVRDEIEKL